MPVASRSVPHQNAVRAIVLLSIAALALAACAGTTAPTSPSPDPGSTIRLYTSVTQGTVDAVVGAYGSAQPDVTIEVFRAPTAELAARIAADLRSGGLQADVLWLTDPLSIAAYADQDLLLAWDPPSAGGIDPTYRTETFFGTRLLNLVLVAGADADPAPADWSDLTGETYRDAIAFSDPGFAGSSFAALGYFALSADHGMDFYRALRENGATKVQAPDDVTTGVAEGRFSAGITLDNSARTAIDKGSPIRLVWPSSGAIAVYSPIAVVAASPNQETARSFADFTLSNPGQAAIATTGWQPVLPGVVGGPTPGGTQVSPDWAMLFGRQDELLSDFRAIFDE